MKARLNLTPAQLVLVSLCGFVISAASLPLIRFVHPKDACDYVRLLPALLVFGIFVLGGAIALKASSDLKHGIANQQWPEEQVAPLRSWLESPICSAFVFLLLVAYGVLWLVFSKYRTTGLASFVLMQVVSQLRTAVRSPRAKPSNLISGWRDLSPIRSDEWGGR